MTPPSPGFRNTTDVDHYSDDPDAGGLRLRQVHLKPCCLHLRHKMMYCDPRQATPGLVDTDSTSRVYFCILTCQSLGPDDQPVEPGPCTSPGRACFRSAQPAPPSQSDDATA